MPDGSEATVVLASQHVRRVGETFVVTTGSTSESYTREQFRLFLHFSAARAGAPIGDILATDDLKSVAAWGMDPSHVGRTAYVSGDGHELLMDSRADGNVYLYDTPKDDHPEVSARSEFGARLERAAAKGKTVACCSNLKNLATALEMYASDSQGLYPKNLQPLLSGNYLRAIPTCPATGTVTYSYKASRRPDMFTLTCSGNNHATAGLPADSPAYSAEQGLIRSEGKE